MVNLDVVAHLQQLVQAMGGLAGVHVSLKCGYLAITDGFKGRANLFIRQQD